MIDLTDYPTPWKAELDTNDTGKWWRVSAVNGMRITGDLPRDIAHLIAASPELFVAASDVCESATYIGKRELAYRVPLTPIDTLEMSLTKARGKVK